jgi:hypothetical protein
MILCAGAGGYASTRLFETEGVFLPPEDQTLEKVLENWGAITDTSQQSELENGMKQSEKFLMKAFNHVQSQQPAE